MDKRTYFRELSRLVSWRLPRAEADEVLRDYRELLSHRPPEGGAALVSALGTPRQAARLVTEPKPYRRWLAAFAGMALCLLIPEFLLLRARFDRFPLVSMAALFALGMALCLLWFRPRQRENRQPLPRGLLPLLAAALGATALAAAGAAAIAAGLWISLPLDWYGPLAQAILWCLGTLAAAAGLLGLVMARTADHRWRAFYVLALTVLVECVLATALLRTLDADISAAWSAHAVHLGVIGAVGLAGTGGCLC